MNLFWEVAYSDIRTKIRLYLGHQQAQIVQDFQNLAEVMKLAFGSGEKKEQIYEPKNGKELQAAFGRVFG